MVSNSISFLFVSCFLSQQVNNNSIQGEMTQRSFLLNTSKVCVEKKREAKKGLLKLRLEKKKKALFLRTVEDVQTREESQYFRLSNKKIEMSS
jgi:hypothetical protein